MCRDVLGCYDMLKCLLISYYTLHRSLKSYEIYIYIYICYLPAARPVLKKYFPEVSEAARDRRPRDASEAEGKYFLVRIDLNGK